MKKYILMILCVVLMSSCAGTMKITAPNSVALNQSNFKFVKTVSAEVNATFVFGIGGMSDRARADVVTKLTEKAQLGPYQALADIRIKTNHNFYALGLVVVRNITATASVVEFEHEGKIAEVSNHTNVSEQPVGSLLPTNEMSVENQKYNRQYCITRLQEIISITKDGCSGEELYKFREEVSVIEKWYRENKFSNNKEKNTLSDVKAILY